MIRYWKNRIDLDEVCKDSDNAMITSKNPQASVIIEQVHGNASNKSHKVANGMHKSFDFENENLEEILESNEYELNVATIRLYCRYSLSTFVW